MGVRDYFLLGVWLAGGLRVAFGWIWLVSLITIVCCERNSNTKNCKDYSNKRYTQFVALRQCSLFGSLFLKTYHDSKIFYRIFAAFTAAKQATKKIKYKWWSETKNWNSKVLKKGRKLFYQFRFFFRCFSYWKTKIFRVYELEEGWYYMYMIVN